MIATPEPPAQSSPDDLQSQLIVIATLLREDATAALEAQEEAGHDWTCIALCADMEGYGGEAQLVARTTPAFAAAVAEMMFVFANIVASSRSEVLAGVARQLLTAAPVASYEVARIEAEREQMIESLRTALAGTPDGKRPTT